MGHLGAWLLDIVSDLLDRFCQVGFLKGKCKILDKIFFKIFLGKCFSMCLFNFVPLIGQVIQCIGEHRRPYFFIFVPNSSPFPFTVFNVGLNLGILAATDNFFPPKCSSKYVVAMVQVYNRDVRVSHHLADCPVNDYTRLCSRLCSLIVFRHLVNVNRR